MVNRQYGRGRAKEYRVIEILRKDGFHAFRSAGSHGAVDVVAAKDGHVLLVQVKSGRARVKKGELEELIRWGRSFNGNAEIWHFKKRGLLEKRRIHAAKELETHR